MSYVKRSAKREKAILAKLAQGWSFSAAAQSAGVHRDTLRNWIAADADFAARVQDAEDDGTDVIEDLVLHAAIRGNLKAQLAMLRARRSKRWGQHVTSEVSGPDGGPIPIIGIEVARQPTGES